MAINKITLSRVAKLAGVSPATVSRTLANPSVVKEETRRRVQRALEQVKYQPTADGQIISSGSKIIGMLSPEALSYLGFNSSVFATQLHAVRKVAEARGYGVFVGTMGGVEEIDTIGEQMLRRGELAGVIIHRPRYEDLPFASVRESGVPFVVLGRLLPNENVACVGIDNEEAGYRATRHLMDFGHRHIGLIGGPENISSAADRLRGYQRALAADGIQFDRELVILTNLGPEAGYTAAKAMLDLPVPPTAIVCVNDFMAIRTIEAARELGLRVPEELSVIGFDNIELGAHFAPSLTTVDIPWADMAELAATLLIKAVERPGRLGQAWVKMKSEVVSRQSSGEPYGSCRCEGREENEETARVSVA